MFTGGPRGFRPPTTDSTAGVPPPYDGNSGLRAINSITSAVYVYGGSAGVPPPYDGFYGGSASGVHLGCIWG